VAEKGSYRDGVGACFFSTALVKRRLLQRLNSVACATLPGIHLANGADRCVATRPGSPRFLPTAKQNWQLRGSEWTWGLWRAAARIRDDC